MVLIRRSRLNLIPVWIQKCDFTEFEFAHSCLNFFPVANNYPDQVFWFDDRISCFNNLFTGNVPHVVSVGIPVVIGQVIGNNLVDVAEYR